MNEHLSIPIVNKMNSSEHFRGSFGRDTKKTKGYWMRAGGVPGTALNRLEPVSSIKQLAALAPAARASHTARQIAMWRFMGFALEGKPEIWSLFRWMRPMGLMGRMGHIKADYSN